MQILHFDWLRYWGSNSNSHRVAKFAGFEIKPTKTMAAASRFFFFLFYYYCLFLSDYLGDTKTIRPFALSGYGSNC